MIQKILAKNEGIVSGNGTIMGAPDPKTVKKIKKQVKDKTDDTLKVSYGIFATDYKEDFAYTVSYSSFIQKGIRS